MNKDYYTIIMATTAVHRMLFNIGNSDFINDYGVRAAYGLREYAADMAVDAFVAIKNRWPNAEERKLIVESFTPESWQRALDDLPQPHEIDGFYDQ